MRIKIALLLAIIASFLGMAVPGRAQIVINYSNTGGADFISGAEPADSLAVFSFSGSLSLAAGVPVTGEINPESWTYNSTNAEGIGTSTLHQSLSITGWTPSPQTYSQTVVVGNFTGHTAEISNAGALTFTDPGVGTIVVTPLGSYESAGQFSSASGVAGENEATFEFTPVPEPFTGALLGLGAAGLLIFTSLRRRSLRRRAE